MSVRKGALASSETAVRMAMTAVESELLSLVLLRAPVDVLERVGDQLWLRTVLIEQRRRTRVAERPEFDARSDRILALLDPQEPEGDDL